MRQVIAQQFVMAIPCTEEDQRPIALELKRNLKTKAEVMSAVENLEYLTMYLRKVFNLGEAKP